MGFGLKMVSLSVDGYLDRNVYRGVLIFCSCLCRLFLGVEVEVEVEGRRGSYLHSYLPTYLPTYATTHTHTHTHTDRMHGSDELLSGLDAWDLTMWYGRPPRYLCYHTSVLWLG